MVGDQSDIGDDDGGGDGDDDDGGDDGDDDGVGGDVDENDQDVEFSGEAP